MKLASLPSLCARLMESLCRTIWNEL